MAVVAVPFILYLVRFCSSKSCKYSTLPCLCPSVPVQRHEYEYEYEQDPAHRLMHYGS